MVPNYTKTFSLKRLHTTDTFLIMYCIVVLKKKKKLYIHCGSAM